MSKNQKQLIIVAVLLALFIWGMGFMCGYGTARADSDPHIPNMGAAYCPGGGMGSQIWLAYCDGTPYPDGSYWHAIQYGLPVIGHPYGIVSPGLQCVMGGGAIPQPDPSGCGQ